MPNKTIGVIGGGELSARMIRAIFKDQLDAAGDATDLKLILPVSKATFTDEIEIVADWATTNGVTFEVVTDGAKPPKAAEEALELATKVHEVRKIPTGLVKILTKADGDLFVFWDDEDEVGYAAFEDAWDAQLHSYDLCNGLELLTFDEEEGEPEEEPEETPEEEPEEEPEPKHEIDEWAELGRKTAKELKQLCLDNGITVNRSGKGRIAKGAYLAALKQFQETGETEYYQEEDLVGGTKPRKGETEPRKPAAKAKEGLVSKDEAREDLADDEPETPDDGQIPEADEDEPVELPSDAEDEDVTAEEETAEILADPEAVEAIAEAEAELEGETLKASWDATSGESGSYGTGGSITANIAYVPAQAGLVGSCSYCGGPIFAHHTNGSPWPEVQTTHMAKCELA